jgi:hypothetical protein
MTHRTRIVHWVGEDDPDRLDASTIRLGDDRLSAIGTTRTAEFATSWSLLTGPDWVTERIEVSAHGVDWSRWLRLDRESSGRWRSEVEQSGTADFAPPGIERTANLADALDCDLALCPVTNTMPILRLRMLDRFVERTALVMAWIDVPSLQVVRSEQIYSSSGPTSGDAGIINYESRDGAFRTALTVDRDGIVFDYPQLARRVR